jgi:Zn-finger nucleic acid-binding protein
MSTERIEEMSLRGNCPLCAALILRSAAVDETEILSCPECLSMLVVDRLEGNNLILGEAPEIEEDWRE